jgi:hypothetical protein
MTGQTRGNNVEMPTGFPNCLRRVHDGTYGFYHILLGFRGGRATRDDSVSLRPTSITGIE